MFNLYNHVIKPAKGFRIKNVEKLRQALKKDHRVIDLYDLKTKNSYRTTVSHLAKNSLSFSKFSSFLYLLLKYLKVERVLETGTSLGINALYLAGPESVKKVVTIEASPIVAKIAKEQFSKLLQHKITSTEGTIQDVLEAQLVKEKPELCFLDADHRSEAILFCINKIIEHVPNVKCIVIHDIYWSRDMKYAWERIVKDYQFALTVDLFQAGLIFPNLEMSKQHFTLRF